MVSISFGVNLKNGKEGPICCQQLSNLELEIQSKDFKVAEELVLRDRREKVAVGR